MNKDFSTILESRLDQGSTGIFIANAFFVEDVIMLLEDIQNISYLYVVAPCVFYGINGYDPQEQTTYFDSLYANAVSELSSYSDRCEIIRDGLISATSSIPS